MIEGRGSPPLAGADCREWPRFDPVAEVRAVSNQELTSFLRACGGAGALEIAVDGPGLTGTAPRSFARPCLLIGRHERADLRLDDPAVSQRHAYLQLIAGRLLCIDLESRSGTLHRGEPVSFTWLDPSETLQIGPFRLRIGLKADGGPGSEAEGPSLGMEQWKGSLKKADLEIRRDGKPTTLWPMPQLIAMVGGSPLCHLRLVGERVTRFAFSLVRTPVGVWMVDLGSSTSIRVNEQPQLLALLGEGDEIPIGPYRLVMRYGGRPEPADLVVTTATPLPAAGGIAASSLHLAPTSPPATAFRSEESLLPAVQGLLEQVVQVQQQMSEQLPQAIAMITQAFGSLQREQMSVVRDELAEIRRLNQEILALRVAAATTGPVAPAVPAPVAAAPPAPEPERPPRSAVAEPAVSEPPLLAPQPRFEPGQVGSFVDSQLARVERERRSRWRKLLRAMLSS